MDASLNIQTNDRSQLALFTIVSVLLPLWVCLCGWILGLQSVGPMVPATWIISSITLPLALYQWSNTIHHQNMRRILKVASLPFGLIGAYIHFVSYMFLSPLFGVNNFDWM